MNNSRCLALCGVLALLGPSALAADLAATGGTSASLLSGGNDSLRYELSPAYSQELGWNLKGAVGGFVTNDIALGLIAEYGQDKREYLTNAGVQLSDGLNLIGTAGMLEERLAPDDASAREAVRQMEYGLSLQSDHEFGALHGFELDGYFADASDRGGSFETGKLYGAQFLTGIALSSAARVKLGGGYEWLSWDGGEDAGSLAFRADAVQQLTEKMSAVADVKLGVSENVFGGGLHYELGEDTGASVLGLGYSRIEGRSGITDDERVQLSWAMALGGNGQSDPAAHVAGGISKSGTETALLADVMKRPGYLPQRVLARAGGDCDLTLYATVYDYPDDSWLRLQWTALLPAGYDSWGDYGYDPTTIIYGGNTAYGRMEANNTQYAIVNMQNDGGISLLDWNSFTGPVTLIVTLKTGQVCTGVFQHP